MQTFRRLVSDGRSLSASLYAGIEVFATKLECKFSYQQVADLLSEFLPDLSCFNHAATGNRVMAAGKAIEAETRAEIAEKPCVEKPVDHMIVGIDGAFVKRHTLETST